MNLENKLDEIFETLSNKPLESLSEQERAFYDVWNWSTLLYIGGFEKLYENEILLEDCIKQFTNIGLEATLPIFEETKKHIKPEYSEKEQWDYFEGHFEELKELAYNYYDATQNICEIIFEYASKHKLGISPLLE